MFRSGGGGSDVEDARLEGEVDHLGPRAVGPEESTTADICEIRRS